MSKERIERRKLWQQMTAGVRVLIQLLDGRRLDVNVSPRLHARDLLALAASHCSFRDTRYFSLAHVADNGVLHWLSHERRLWEHDSLRAMASRTVTIAFLVKFYPSSVTELRGAPEVELFYQHARHMLAKDQLGVESSRAFQLAALALQASYGDYVDTSLTHSQLKKSSLLPTSVLHDHPSLLYCEERVAADHLQLVGLSRGDAIIRFMREVESLPTYGIHYYEVRDKNDLPWYIGLSNRGISQYDYLDKRKPRRVFLWRQLENIYFRERKFSIEVHDPKRSCVSRRSLGSTSSSVTVHVWFAESQGLCKAIWSMAIAQHQFYLDRKTLRSEDHSSTLRDMPELAVDLSRSCMSLSTHSSTSNLSHSGSHSSLHQHSQTESGSSESLEAARLEMLEALKQRKNGLQEKLNAKTEELRILCLREGELTGELPPEYPMVPGQAPPTVRKRVGTSFALDETIINKIINKQEETVSALELECEIMAKITSAALRLANEGTAKKGVRRQRKLFYQQSTHRLRELEHKLKLARNKAVVTASTLPKQKKKRRPLSETEGIEDSGITGSLSSSAGSNQDSPREAPSFPTSLHATPEHSPSLAVDAPRRRDRSPHLGRNSAPASPHRGAGSTSSSSALNTTVTSSSSSRPSSPSRPSRFGSLDRRRGNSSSRVESSRSSDQHDSTLVASDQTPPSSNTSQYQKNQLEHQSRETSHIVHTTSQLAQSPQQSAHLSSENQHHHSNGGGYNQMYANSRSHFHNVSSSKLRHVSSSYLPTQVHNISSSSIASHHAHNTTSSSIGSSASGATLSNSSGQPASYNQSSSYAPNTSSIESHTPQVHHNFHHGSNNVTQHQTATPMGGSHNNTRIGPGSNHAQLYSRSGSTNMQQHPQQTALVQHDKSRSHPQQMYCSQSAPQNSSQHVTQLNTSSHHTQYPLQHKPHYDNQPTPLSSRHQQQREYLNDTVTNGTNSSLNHSFDTRTSGEDCVDGYLPNSRQYHHSQHRQAHLNHSNVSNAQDKSPHILPQSVSTNKLPEAQPTPETVHTLVRTSSGRSYMETTFLGDSSSASSTTSNQENIPPQRSQHLPPLRPTSSHLRASSSVAPADMAPPRLLPAVDLIPLRATKSSSEFPPLRATNPRGEHPPSVNVNTNQPSTEPLMSLAEAARLKKDREREWYETCLDSPINGRRNQRNTVSEIIINKVPNANINISTSSSSSPYPSPSEGTESQVSSTNGRTQAMMITTGTYQPSREVSKPFEMSDFYKYSTKYRKQNLANSTGLNSSNSSFSAGSDSTMSPVLPPRAQVVVSSNKTAPPSPNVVAQQSIPAAQQKGVYQSLAPYTCQGVAQSSPTAVLSSQQQTATPSWEGAQIHQAVPATVTTKRSATLV